MYQSGQRNMEFFQDEVLQPQKGMRYRVPIRASSLVSCQVFFDRVDGKLVLRAIVIEVALKTTWQIPYLEAWLQAITRDGRAARLPSSLRKGSS